MASDHTPIILTVSESVIKRENHAMLTNRRTDWDSFKNSLEKKIYLLVPLNTTDQLEDEAKLFVDNIQQAAWENTPELRTKGNNYPKKIRELIRTVKGEN